MYLHKTKNGHYTPPCCYFSGELEVVECLPQTCYWVDSERNLEYVSKPKHDLSKLLYNMVLIHPSTFVKKKAYALR